MQTIFIPKETRNFEQRVALIPKDVKTLGKKFTILIEKDAGLSAGYTDEQYSEQGAQITSLKDGLEKSDFVIFVQGPEKISNWPLSENQTVIGLLDTFQQPNWLTYFSSKKCSSLALEMIPRITRAQSMDILSSQSNLAGYKAALLAVENFQGVIPMLMTAAGSISPAKVLVLGAGVAGLQAIATAKRLGAQVSASDVRAAAKEQVESLGAQFLEVETDEDMETAGGYAKESSEEYRRKQQELINEELSKVDIVITTALIPGRLAPVLITKEQVDLMKRGAIIVDMAVSMGGNCALSKSGENVNHNDVMILGHPNIASLVAKDSSKFFSKNISNLMTHMAQTEKEQLTSDQILKECLIHYQGQIVHERFKEPTAEAV